MSRCVNSFFAALEFASCLRGYKMRALPLLQFCTRPSFVRSFTRLLLLQEFAWKRRIGEYNTIGRATLHSSARCATSVWPAERRLLHPRSTDLLVRSVQVTSRWCHLFSSTTNLPLPSFPAVHRKWCQHKELKVTIRAKKGAQPQLLWVLLLLLLLLVLLLSPLPTLATTKTSSNGIWSRDGIIRQPSQLGASSLWPLVANIILCLAMQYSCTRAAFTRRHCRQ